MLNPSYACDCEFNSFSGSLSCSSGSIVRFPEDFFASCSSLVSDLSSVTIIDLQDQPIAEIKKNAFKDFPMLQQIMLSFCEIERIEEGAFNGLESVNSLYLRNNYIEELPDGVLDSLVSLSFLDISGNPIQNYTTQSWTFCHGINYDFDTIKGMDVLQDFHEKMEIEDNYCQVWIENHFPSFDQCQEDGDILDCTNLGSEGDTQGLGCFVSASGDKYAKVFVNFPREPRQIQDFGAGTSNAFFTEFNSGDNDLSRLRRSLTFYGTTFDLASLESKTNRSVTREVMVKADSVYMSRPLSISYNLKIRARVVSLEHEITMELTKSQFSTGNFRTKYINKVVFGNSLIMRNRRMGLIDIVDHFPEEDVTDDQCEPKPVYFNATSVSMVDWFDAITVNLLYVCAATVQPENNVLAVQMADFNLRFHQQKEIVSDPKAFLAAQKFQRIKELGQNTRARNVPGYGLKVIKELASIMHERMDQYWTIEQIQIEDIKRTQDRIKDVAFQFQIIEVQQEQYFQKEQDILNAIFDAQDNNWNWTFQHRNLSDESIRNATEITGGLVTDLQEQELKRLLEQAKSQVEHMRDVVNQYETEVQRYKDVSEGSVQVIKQYNENLNQATVKMEEQLEIFEANIQAWITQQIIKQSLAFMKCLTSLFTDALKAEVDPMAIAGDFIDIASFFQDLYKMMKDLGDILATLWDLTDDNLGEIAVNPSTEFNRALQNAVDFKMKAPQFAMLKNQADNQLMMVADFGIRGVDGLSMAYTETADNGLFLVNELVDFADNVLKWSERNDQLEVAKRDLNRTLDQVADIQQSLEDLENTQNDYQDQMDQNQQDYQDKLHELEVNYENTSMEMRHEYLNNITKKFEAFKETYENMKELKIQSLQSTIDAVLYKSYGMKEASMTQRSMISVLYQDFCQALFYHKFEDCTKDNFPLMSDDFSSLLSKLNNLQWDSVQDVSALQPTIFPNRIFVEDVDNYTQPITQLRNVSRTTINFKDFLSEEEFNSVWRWRLDDIQVTLLDEHENVIPSLGIESKYKIKTGITFPNFFNDKDEFKNSHTFLGQRIFCRSSFVTQGEGTNLILIGLGNYFDQSLISDNDVYHMDKCQVTDEFSANAFKPSGDGSFAFHLENDEDTLDKSKVAKLQIDLIGSGIPFPSRKQSLLSDE